GAGRLPLSGVRSALSWLLPGRGLASHTRGAELVAVGYGPVARLASDLAADQQVAVSLALGTVVHSKNHL
ncbi:MAG: hypothetical protein RMJ88_00980, partial [Thermogemmata sp.]|nr:hypothetical protein [Thermogemmata sp.]